MIARRVRPTVLASLSGVLALLSSGTVACVLADKGIEFEDAAISNRYPVRIVEAALLSDEAVVSCDENQDDMMFVRCAQPGDIDPTLVLPHFLDPRIVSTDSDQEGSSSNPYQFCTCTAPEVDTNRLLATLYIEDQDEFPQTRDPKDKIYAALLLDLPRNTDNPKPYNHVDYERYVGPENELPQSELPYTPRLRRPLRLREINLGITLEGEDRGLDLCNGGREPLAVGYHTLTVMVTDRKWFQPPSEPGQPQPRRQIGVPDLDAGATFDTVTYVFRCASEAEDEPNDCADACRSPDEDIQ